MEAKNVYLIEILNFRRDTALNGSQSAGSSLIVTGTEVAPVICSMLFDETTTSNVSFASTASSFRMVILIQRGGLPTVSPGWNTSDVFRDKKSRPAE